MPYPQLFLFAIIICLAGPLATVATAQGVSCRVAPYPANSVPEATSGFAHPLGSRAERRPGYTYAEKSETIYCKKVYGAKIWVYHPARDINAKSGDGDLGVPVYSVADGIVVFAFEQRSKYSGVVVEHNYRGSLFYSQYGHVQNIGVRCGQVVVRGQQLAEIGKNGASSAHLHFEIRNASHPDPVNGLYFCQTCSGSPCLQNLSNVMTWYEDPLPFIAAHGPYSNAQAALAIDLSPNPAIGYYETCGDAGPPVWYFQATITETNGVGIQMGEFVTEFFDDGGHYLFSQTNPATDFPDFFSYCGPTSGYIAPRTSVCANLCGALAGGYSGYLRITFAGTDANGHTLSFRSPYLTMSRGNYKTDEPAPNSGHGRPGIKPRP